jgi:hypothetical protein
VPSGLRRDRHRRRDRYGDRGPGDHGSRGRSGGVVLAVAALVVIVVVLILLNR